MKTQKSTFLSKYLAHAGVCARRQATPLIHEGKVTINDKIVLDPATPVFEQDTVRVNGLMVAPEEQIYLVLNKPAGYITTVSDDEGRDTVMHLLRKRLTQRVYPVGRLDRNTTGALLVTNDGHLAHQLLHPSRQIQKVYCAQLDRALKVTDRQALLRGIMLDDGPAKADRIWSERWMSTREVCVSLHNGRQRIIRRMFKALGYTVRKLERLSFAGLTTQGIRPGHWRELSKKEVESLRTLDTSLVRKK